jgi:hypothetical protein
MHNNRLRFIAGGLFLLALSVPFNGHVGIQTWYWVCAVTVGSMVALIHPGSSSGPLPVGETIALSLLCAYLAIANFVFVARLFGLLRKYCLPILICAVPIQLIAVPLIFKPDGSDIPHYFSWPPYYLWVLSYLVLLIALIIEKRNQPSKTQTGDQLEEQSQLVQL